MRVKHECPSCTCGLTEISWSDREGYIDLSDPQDIADTFLNIALDHSYDRNDGIPYGDLPDSLIELIRPVLDAHLGAIEPDWRNKTVYMYDKPESKAEFRSALLKAATEFVSSK